MLKYEKIISELTVRQKLELLTGRRTQTAQAAADVPVLNAAYLQDLNKTADGGAFYPPLCSTANSWNPELIKKVSAELSLRAKAEKINAVITPDLCVKTNAYRDGTTEDPYLGGKIAAACAKGIAEAGAMPVLANCSFTERDTDFLDREVNKSVIFDYAVRPVETALTECAGSAVMTSYTRLKGNYRDVNLNIEFSNNTRAVCEKANDGLAAASLYAGNTYLLNGNIRELEDAHNNYIRLQRALDNNEITVEEFQSEVRGGKAVSEETLNSWTDRFLDFAFECEKRAAAAVPENTGAEMLARRAADESVVLLKNTDNILPLKAGVKVAVIGPADAVAGAEFLSFKESTEKRKGSLPFEYTGYAAGYGFDKENGAAHMQRVSSLAYSSDAIVIFLDADCVCRPQAPADKNLKLPANRAELIASLEKAGKKIIAVMTDGCAPDMSFDEACPGLILIPQKGAYRYDSLLKVLTGELNPSGKLACTLYDNTDEYFSELKKDKDSGNIKIGAFFGYRNYDTAGTAVKYPFGHGLSYTTFSYSEFGADAFHARFRVKNTGAYTGCETAQVYIGKPDSGIARPQKELKGFAKVYLKPGESKFVNIAFGPADLAVYDSERGERVTEKGDYTAYAGSSVSDVRLEKSFNVATGRTFIGKKDNLSDYSQTKSNIVSGGYTLAGKYAGKELTRPKVIAMLMLIAAGLFDIIVAVAGVFNDGLIVAAVLFNLLIPAAVAVLITDRLKRKKAYEKTEEVKEQTVRQNETVITDEPELEKLFLQEFKESAEPERADTEAARDGEDISQFIDKSLTMEAFAVQLTSFLRERGVTAEPPCVRAVLSAMSSSRIVILKCADAVMTEKFIAQLCLYFGTAVYADAAAAAADADLNVSLMHIAALKGLENIAIKIAGIPQNLRLAVILPQDAALGSIPLSIAENAAAVDIRLRETAESPEKSPVRQMNVHQFLKLCRDSGEKYLLSESMWKKADRFEDYASERAGYRIGNKAWRAIEQYTSVYLACGGTEAEALDSVIAAKLLPVLIPLLKAGDPDGDGSLSLELERIFGEGNASECMSAVKYAAKIPAPDIKNEKREARSK